MNITKKRLRELVRKSLLKEDEWDSSAPFDSDRLSIDTGGNKQKSQARVIHKSRLRPSKNALKAIIKYEGFRPRVYDDTQKTDRSSGPWITSLGWDPFTGEKIDPDPISGRLGGDKFKILSFETTTRMSKTNGVPTVGYGFALNNAEKTRMWAHHLGGEGIVSPDAGLIDPEIESWSYGEVTRRDMTIAEADEILASMLPYYSRNVRAQLSGDILGITQDQFDALVSRAWNEGPLGAKTVMPAISLLNQDTEESWEEAGKVGRFNDGSRRGDHEGELMDSWMIG